MKYPNSDNTSILTPKCLKEKVFFLISYNYKER